ncbi:hypothetical protein E1B28_002210 [Marasmius oreades]|uniref:Uncharacterized protein n=1 Tax=Marasmius oreades TaxID=181124 RepID=A0A9P7UNQ4_9AGAR|nr:uncharacterized protein E1B28_002210 [Marasmius oreades]KAG7086239.1 hypothetical protein E1B28_002210 [Marasmius oreades]
MRSFKSWVFLIILLCLTDFARSLPTPAKAAKKTVAKKPAAMKKPATAKKLAVPVKSAASAKKPVAPKKPAAPVKKPAAKQPAAKKPTTPAKPTTVVKKPTPAAKKPATTIKKPTAKPVTPIKSAANNSAAKKPPTSPVKPVVPAKPVTVIKKPAAPAKPATAAKKPATTAKKPTTAKPATPAGTKPVANNAGKKPATPTAKPASGSKKLATPAKSATPSKGSATPAKPSNSAAKKPANSTANACPAPKPDKATTATKAKKKARELIEAVVDLFRRDTFEFVGFHGTNGENGNIYMNAAKTKGTIVTPFKFNGNDGELGGGLYITDDFTTAHSFADTSANNRKADAKKKGCPLQATDDAGKGVVCKVEAKSSSNFRNLAKLWIPPDEIARPIPGIGNDPKKLAQQETRIRGAGANPFNALRFSVLSKANPKDPKIGNQFMLPPGAFGDFIIRQCVPTTAGKPSGTKEFPAFNFRNQDADWNIAGDPFGELDSTQEGDITDANKPRP